MRRPITKTLVLAVALLAPLAAGAQENSIMQSFHPEKYPAPKTEAGKQTEPDRPKNVEAKPSTEAAPSPAEAK